MYVVRVITKARLKQAQQKYPQWSVGLYLWYQTFSTAGLKFESFQQIKDLWKSKSGWNVDRVPARNIKEVAFEGDDFDLYIFDIHGTNCRILTRINTQQNRIFLRKILPHAAYDKWCKEHIIR